MDLDIPPRKHLLIVQQDEHLPGAGLAPGLLLASLQLLLLGFSITHSLPFNFLCLYHWGEREHVFYFHFSFPRNVQSPNWTEVLFPSCYQDTNRDQSWSTLNTRLTGGCVTITLHFSVCYSSAPPWPSSLLLLQGFLLLLSPKITACHLFPSFCFVLSFSSDH